MRTDIEILAEPGRSPRMRCSGGLSARRTGRTSVHLVGAAATPLGGDHIEIVVRVADGATLEVGSVAATMALPSAHRADSTARWYIEVGANARLRLNPQPTVIAGGADHRSTTVVTVAADAAIDLYEHVQIGRSIDHDTADGPGRWQSTMTVDLGGRPLLRHTVALGAGSASAAAGLRALTSVLRYPDPRPGVVDAEHFAVRMALPGESATLTTALGTSLRRAQCHGDVLDAAAAPLNR